MHHFGVCGRLLDGPTFVSQSVGSASPATVLTDLPPRALVPVGQLGGGGAILLATSGKRLVVGAGTHCLIYDISVPSLPVLLGQVHLAGHPTALAVNGDWAYLAVRDAPTGVR